MSGAVISDAVASDAVTSDAVVSEAMHPHASGNTVFAQGVAIPSSRVGLTFPTDSSASPADSPAASASGSPSDTPTASPDGSSMSTSPADCADTAEVRSQFEAIVADMLWHHRPKTETTPELLGRLLAVTPGIELMRELQAINADDLEPDQRLIHTHLWERCVGVGHRPGRGIRRGFHRRPHRPTRRTHDRPRRGRHLR